MTNPSLVILISVGKCCLRYQPFPLGGRWPEGPDEGNQPLIMTKQVICDPGPLISHKIGF